MMVSRRLHAYYYQTHRASNRDNKLGFTLSFADSIKLISSGKLCLDRLTHGHTNTRFQIDTNGSRYQVCTITSTRGLSKSLRIVLKYFNCPIIVPGTRVLYSFLLALAPPLSAPAPPGARISTSSRQSNSGQLAVELSLRNTAQPLEVSPSTYKFIEE